MVTDLNKQNKRDTNVQCVTQSILTQGLDYYYQLEMEQPRPSEALAHTQLVVRKPAGLVFWETWSGPCIQTLCTLFVLMYIQEAYGYAVLKPTGLFGFMWREVFSTFMVVAALGKYGGESLRGFITLLNEPLSIVAGLAKYLIFAFVFIVLFIVQYGPTSSSQQITRAIVACLSRFHPAASNPSCEPEHFTQTPSPQDALGFAMFRWWNDQE